MGPMVSGYAPRISNTPVAKHRYAIFLPQTPHIMARLSTIVNAIVFHFNKASSRRFTSSQFTIFQKASTNFGRSFL